MLGIVMSPKLGCHESVRFFFVATSHNIFNLGHFLA